jgi:hypothetical protein
MPSYDRALWALRSWLDSWSGMGHVTVGMARQGYDLQLSRYDEKGWRATFYTTGMEHSPTSATSTAWERTPWHATDAFGGVFGALGPSRQDRGEVCSRLGVVKCRRCERPNRVQRIHLFPPVTGRYPMRDAPPISTESSQIRVG